MRGLEERKRRKPKERIVKCSREEKREENGREE